MARASTAGIPTLRRSMRFHIESTQEGFESLSEEEKNKEIEDVFNEILEKARQGEGHAVREMVSIHRLFWGISEKMFLELAVVEESLDTVLHIAAANGDLKLMSCICDGFNNRGTRWPFEPTRSLLIGQNANGDTPLHCAARAGHMNAALSLFSDWTGPWHADTLEEHYEDWPPGFVPDKEDWALARELLDIKNKSGKTAAEEAEAAGNTDIAHWLAHIVPKGEAEVAFKSLPISEADRVMHDFCNEIITATQQNNGQQLVEMIWLRSLDWGVLPQKILDTAVVDGTGDNCLHIAASSGDLEMVPMIINEIDYVGCAPKHRVASLLTGKQNANGDTPLHCAARIGPMDAVVCLLINWSFPKSMKEMKKLYETWPPELSYRSSSPKRREHDLELLNIRNNAGRTAVEEAVAAGRMDIAYWLVHMAPKPEQDGI